MQKSGKTPLLRARKLEKLFDVGEIYIKLEGMNPTGHKHDRIAEVLVKDATAHNYKSFIVNGSQSYIASVKNYAEENGFTVKVPMFKKEQWKTRKLSPEVLFKASVGKDESEIDALKKAAADEEAYLAIEGYTSTHISQMALESLTDEITRKLSYKVDTIFTQMSYGYTLTSIYSSLLRQWIDGNLESFPKVICSTWDDVKNIYETYQDTYSLGVKNTPVNENREKSFQGNRELMEASMQAVMETNGEIQSVSPDMLKESARFLKKHEQIKLTSQQAYPFASFYEMAKAGSLEKGRHVIVLNDAKSEISVDNLNDFDELSKEELIEYTRTWLAQYSDSILETEEAIQNAMEKGFLLIASRNGSYEGICVVVNMEYEHFHPTYHLAYVGTDKTSKGRGVATELIKKAIDLSDGKISLHVDLDNKGAKRLYEKLGFKHCYNRMIYKEQA